MKIKPFLLFTIMSLFSANSIAKTYIYLSNQDKGNVSLYSFNTNNGDTQYIRNFIATQGIINGYITPNKKYFYSSTMPIDKDEAIVSWKIDPKNGYLKEKYVSTGQALRYIISDRNSEVLFLSEPDSYIVGKKITDKAYFVRNTSYSDEYNLLSHTDITISHTIVSVDNKNKNVYISSKNYQPEHYLFSDGVIKKYKQGYDGMKESNEGSSYSVFSPDNKYLYNLTYKSGNIVQYKINQENGELSKIEETISPLYDKYSKSSNIDIKFEGRDNFSYYTDNDLRMTSDGKFIYTSDNVNNTIRGYKINKDDGKLSLINTWKTENIPNNFAIDESNKWLIVSGERSDYISIYSINPDSGKLDLLKRVKVFDDKGKEGQKSISIVTF